MALIDLTNAVEQGSPLPNGTYPVIVDNAELSLTKSGTGQVIKVKLKVLEGPSAGRLIFDQFNIKNQNPQAVQIGLGQLKGFLRAFGHRNPNTLESTTELLGLKGLVNTKVQEDPGYQPTARVTSYKPLQAVSAPGEASAPAAQGASPF